ncbi:MAG: Gfo/Idh/MocA family oxidoreductase [bacterium]
MRVGVIGIGYWGPNVLRNFVEVLGQGAVGVCDHNKERLLWAKNLYPDIQLSEDSDELIHSSAYDIIAICTPLKSHYALAKKALQSKKHVFIEKPFTQTSKEAQDLITLAEKNGCTVMIDHPQLYSPAFEAIQTIINHKEFGTLYYLDAKRANLGRIQPDCNVIWDLAVHDFASLMALISCEAETLAVHSQYCVPVKLKQDFAQRASIDIQYKGNIKASISLNWVSPIKVRENVIVSDKKMIHWNELDQKHPIHYFDSQVHCEDNGATSTISYHHGKVSYPNLDKHEPLKKQIMHFLNCIDQQKQPFNNHHLGLKVLRFLEACDQSLQQKGKYIKIR